VTASLTFIWGFGFVQELWGEGWHWARCSYLEIVDKLPSCIWSRICSEENLRGCMWYCAAANQPIHHFLQFSKSGGIVGKEDHRTWVLVFLYPCKDVTVTSQPSVSWFQKWGMP
jgi:hypothetical protein